jgi:uncharacterized integral membrane protein (TIGR00697 family)
MNEFLWLAFAGVNFLLVSASYRFFGKNGLFAWIAMGTVIANIQVTKTIELFGLTATLGNIMYGSIFLVTDALNEIYGVKEAKKAVMIGFFSLISTVVIMQMALWFQPGLDDFAQDALETIFGLLPRIALGSLTAYIISQWFDVHLFGWLKDKQGNSDRLYLRNIVSTLASQGLDTLIFVPIAFIGLYPFEIVLQIAFTTYFIKVLVALMDTPFVYLLRSFSHKVG